MSQKRLNNFTLLTIYKERLDGLNLITTVHEFSNDNDEKKSVFETFKMQGYVKVNKGIAFCLYTKTTLNTFLW